MMGNYHVQFLGDGESVMASCYLTNPYYFLFSQIHPLDPDTTLRLWDVKTGTPIGEGLQGHTTSVLSVDFSPDGKKVVTSSAHDPKSHWDNIILVWDIDEKSWVERLCDIARRNFTQAEWGNYLGNQPYEKTCSNRPVHFSQIEFWLKEASKRTNSTEVMELYNKAKKASQEHPAEELIELWLDTLDIFVDKKETQLSLEIWKLIQIWSSELDSNKQDFNFLGRLALKLAKMDSLELNSLAGEVYAQLTKWGIDTNNTLLNNKICWDGSLYGFAQEVLPSCEHAVALAIQYEANLQGDEGSIQSAILSLATFRNSRGLALALSNKLEEASQDFKFYLEIIPENRRNEQKIRSRKDWIKKFEEGSNPFTEEVMDWLRKGQRGSYPFTE